MKRACDIRRLGRWAAALSVVLVFGCSQEPVSTPDERLQAAGTEAAHLLMRSRQATQAGRYNEALALADQLIQQVPDLPAAHYQRGILLLRLHQLGAADSALARATALDPYYRGAWYQRGHVAFEDANYPEAIRHYRKQRDMILDSPRKLRDYYRDTDAVALPQTWLQIGRAYQLMQEADSARHAYEQVLALDATHAQAHAWLSELYDEEGRVDEALTHARQARQYEAENPDFGQQLGALLVKSGQLEEAVPLLERAVAAQPWDASATYNLGRALVSLGRTDEGERYLAMTDQLQELEQAINHAKAGAARYPEDPARWEFLANLLGRAGRSAEQQQALAVMRTLRAAEATSR